MLDSCRFSRHDTQEQSNYRHVSTLATPLKPLRLLRLARFIGAAVQHVLHTQRYLGILYPLYGRFCRRRVSHTHLSVDNELCAPGCFLAINHRNP
jgi:hypothetical protein